MKNLILSLSLFLICGQAWSQETTTAPVGGTWVNETEAALVRVNGNTKSESYSLKQKTEFSLEMNKLVGAGRYVQSKSGSVEIGRAWDASLRYERSLSDQWSLFLEQGAESDAFAGYVQRDHTDLGAKYFFWKEAKHTLFAEAGARRSVVNPVGPAPSEENTSGRAYAEWNKELNETVTAKFWLEYLPNSKDAGAYRANYEPSLSVMMSKVFSMKLSYLVKYQNKVAAGAEKEDTTLTSSIVAKF